MTKLPDWALAERYEYDLGMATSCEMCDAPLTEGQTVYRDTEPHYYDNPPRRLPTSRFCSEKCVREYDAPPDQGPGPVCDGCGDPIETGLLCEVDNSDSSVGYRDTLILCPQCVTARRVGRPMVATKPEYEDGTLDCPGRRLAPGNDDDAELDAGLVADAQDAGLRPRKDGEHG